MAKEIIKATKAGVKGKIPISVKTRIGFKNIVTEKWSRFLLSQEIDALTVHGRTTKELSNVPCHWDEIGKVVKIRDEMGINTLIIGNGDVKSLDEMDKKVKEYGVDGVMIGRGVFTDPYIFNSSESIFDKTPSEKIELMKKHINLYKETWGDKKNYSELKRYYKVYINGFAGAAKMRDKLMKTNEYEEVFRLIDDIQ